MYLKYSKAKLLVLSTGFALLLSNQNAVASHFIQDDEINQAIESGKRLSKHQVTANVFQLTLRACDQGYQTQEGHIFTPTFLEAERLQNESKKFKFENLSIAHSQNYRTIIRVVDQDSFVAAEEMIKQGLSPCVSNAANAHTPGGGVVNGSLAQEEELCRRSTLYKGLLPALFPMQDDELIHNPQVTVFINPTTYSLMNQPFKVGVISQAYINLSAEYTDLLEGEKSPQYQNRTTAKIRAFFRLAASQGYDSMVLAASGCGAFSRGRPGPVSEVVAKLFHQVTEENEFKGVFKEIRFAILAKGFNPIINETFQREFGFRHSLAVEGQFPYTLKEGFSGAEGTHRWTDGKSATIEVNLDADPTRRPLAISFLDTSAFLPQGIKQPLMVRLNGIPIDEYQYDNIHNLHTINVLVPLRIQGTAKIEFQLPQAVSPNAFKELNNQDSRLLGIALKDVVIAFADRY